MSENTKTQSQKWVQSIQPKGDKHVNVTVIDKNGARRVVEISRHPTFVRHNASKSSSTASR
ncbi:hypothetical protein JXA47_00520 [Candidatus Sumerlaeota bacterium]|nr:hypothetical protein [Candidatus Sumerlaeota bacterium]